VVLRKRPVVRELDSFRAALRELHRKPTELRRERDVRRERLEILGAKRRDVHGIRDEPTLEGGGYLLGDDHACPVLRLRGGSRQMRRYDDVVELEQRARVRL